MIFDLFMTICLIFIVVFLYFCFHCASPIVCSRIKSIYISKGFNYKIAIRKRDYFVDKVIDIFGYKKYFLVHKAQKNIANTTILCIYPIIITNNFFRFDYPKLRMLGLHHCKCIVKIKNENNMIGTLIVPLGTKNDGKNITGAYKKELLENNKRIYICADQKNTKQIISYLNKLVSKENGALNNIWAIDFKSNEICFFYNIDILKAYRWHDDFSKAKKIEYTNNCISVITKSINNFI